MGIPVGIDVRDAWVDPRVLDRRLRVAALGRRDVQHLSPRQRDQPPGRRDAGAARRGPAGARRARPLRGPARRARAAASTSARAGALDPSAFVKGWAIEAVATMLGEAGARNLCVHAGGDVRVRGERTPGQPWRVGIQHPWQRDRVAAVLCTRGAWQVAPRAPTSAAPTSWTRARAGHRRCRVGHGPRPRSRHRRRLRHRGLCHGRRRARVDGRARRLRRAEHPGRRPRALHAGRRRLRTQMA
jgi:hypothetical protein